MKRSIHFVLGFVLLVLLGPQMVALGGTPAREARGLPPHHTASHQQGLHREVPATHERPLHHETRKPPPYDLTGKLAAQLKAGVERRAGATRMKSPLVADADLFERSSEALALALQVGDSEEQEAEPAVMVIPKHGLVVLELPNGTTHVAKIEGGDEVLRSGEPGSNLVQLGNVVHVAVATKTLPDVIRWEQGEFYYHARGGQSFPLKAPKIVELEPRYQQESMDPS